MRSFFEKLEQYFLPFIVGRPQRRPRDIAITSLLFIASRFYRMVTQFRIWLYDRRFFRYHALGCLVVSIGNLSCGGTGKTPHTEFIISLLCSTYNVAMLSRGYKRKTSGFVMAFPNCTPYDIGDEAYQIYQKFGDRIKVAVCESRVKGINKLREIDSKINLIVLDDAFQHRYVRPSLSIVLTEYSHPFYDDKMLPLGRLRESKHSIKERADAVIITKCPEDIKPVDFRIFKKRLSLFSYQKLYFSKYTYGSLNPVFPDASKYIPMLEIFTEKDTILAITGIANPIPLIKHLKQYKPTVKVMHFPDHHNFSRNDINDIVEVYNTLKGRYKIIITTEKDAVRIANNPYFPYELKQHIFYQPINVEFLPYDTESFNEWLSKRIEGKD